MIAMKILIQVRKSGNNVPSILIHIDRKREKEQSEKSFSSCKPEKKECVCGRGRKGKQMFDVHPRSPAQTDDGKEGPDVRSESIEDIFSLTKTDKD